MNNRVTRFLKKFEIEHTFFGEDALDIKLKDTTITLSVFDDDLQICCYVERDNENNNKIISEGFVTYDSLISGLLKLVTNY